ncbi:phenylalanine ammonia-lyase [Auricularia subglabra TFB-10046 SS5]|nr:phenylalanine ammonia-lyase [Auricularia subglabra TFB-10046 SS5]
MKSKVNGHSVNGVDSGYTSNDEAVAPRSTDRIRRHETLTACFVESQTQLQNLRRLKVISIDGQSLSVPALVAIARYGASIELDSKPELKAAVDASREALESKLRANISIYGVSTGYGGSADTRTRQYNALGASLLQHHHSGVLPHVAANNCDPNAPLAVNDAFATLSMPISWVRGAMAVRMNSLARGHSGVRWQIIQQLGELICCDITPLVPLRGTISASGDLTPLAYVAGAMCSHPHIRVRTRGGEIMRASEAGIPKLQLQDKENLGIMNGTAFSAALGALAMQEAVQLGMLAQLCTALGTEALLGTQASHVPFIHDECRPHPGQVECARNIYQLLEGSKLATTGTAEAEVSIEEDGGHLRQDRYPLRTAAQYLGPWLEDILAAHTTVSLECNTTTDNPLIDGKTGHVHHGGNFQAMAVTSAMEKTRLALFHIGKLLFSQLTEMLNPLFSNGLPPSVAASEPSTDYHAKGLDINAASYVSELGYLANPVSTHVQSAEMHNQAVNSLAFISARQTMTAIDVLSMLVATYLYVLCQAIDIRALQEEFARETPILVSSLLSRHFGSADAGLLREIQARISASLVKTTTQDVGDRMFNAAEGASILLYRHFPERAAAVQLFTRDLSAGLVDAYNKIRAAFISGARTSVTESYMAPKTRRLYTFIRNQLGIEMHGLVNYQGFIAQDGQGGLAFGERSIGESVSIIYAALREGKMGEALTAVFSDV